MVSYVVILKLLAKMVNKININKLNVYAGFNRPLIL